MEKPVFRVRRTPCPTCIYRKDSALDLARLEAEVRDEHGAFESFRVCHHHEDDSGVCCRGFWNRWKLAFLPSRLAILFGLVEETDTHGSRFA